MSKLTDTLARLWQARQVYNEVEAEHQAAKAAGVSIFQEEGVDHAEVVVGDRLVKGTLVEGTQVVLDEGGLLDALTQKQRDTITSARIDKDKLEAAVKVGLIKADLVASFSEIVPKAPYILLKDVQAPAPAIGASVKRRTPSKGTPVKKVAQKATQARRKAR